jgi:hypothetical protein
MEKIKKSYYDETLINNLANMLRMPREEVIDKLWANKVLTTKVQKASREDPSNNPEALRNRASFNARKPAWPERQAQARADVATAAGPQYRNSLADLSGMIENHQNANGERAPIPLDVLASKVNAKADDSLESSLVNKGISDVNPYIGTQYDITNVESLSRLLGMPESEVIGKLTKSLFRKGVNNEDDDSFMKRDDSEGEEGEVPPEEEEEGEMPPEEKEEGEMPPDGKEEGDEDKSGMPLARSLSLLDVFYASPSSSQKKN